MTKFENVVHGIKQQIANGTYGVGDQLPTMVKLCKVYGVSMITVKRALDDLEAAGVITRKQGKGTFVRNPLTPASAIDQIRATVTTFSCIIPTDEECLALHISPDEFCIHFVRTCMDETGLTFVEHGGLPVRYVPSLRRDQLDGNLVHTLKDLFGLKIVRISQALSAVTPSQEDAACLGCGTDDAVLEIRSTYHLPDDTAVGYTCSVLDPSFVYTSLS